MPTDFFQTIPPLEKIQIKARADQLTQELEAWSQDYSIIRSVRIPMVATLISTVLPQLAPANALLVAKLTFWIFRLDDVVDEKLVPIETLNLYKQDWQLIIANPTPPALDYQDQMSQILLEIKSGMAKSALFNDLYEPWAAEWSHCVDTIMEGYTYPTESGHMLPLLNQYMERSIHSVGLLCWMITACILLEDASILQTYQTVHKSLEYASSATRLYNDLRSYEKDVTEGNINAVLIIYHQLRLANPKRSEERLIAEAKRYIFQMAHSQQQLCYQRLKRINSDQGHVEQVIHRLVTFHSQFYGDDATDYDYHTTTLIDIDEWLR